MIGSENAYYGGIVKFKLAVAQPFCFPGEVTGNLGRMRPLIEQAAANGARLILFGESNVTGLWDDERTIAAALEHDGQAWRQLTALAREHDIVVTAGFLERDNGKVFNALGAFFPTGEVVVQRKTCLTPIETRIPNAAAGAPGAVTFAVDGVRCAITICADAGLPDLWNELARRGVQVHLIPTAGCGPRALGFHEKELDDPSRVAEFLKKAESVVFSRDAILTCRQHRMVMASCNQMADNGVDYFHPGHSMIVDSTGELSALIPGSFVFEHLRPRVACGEVHPQTPVVLKKGCS